MNTIKMIKIVILYNWLLEVLDENGEQIPEYQGSYDNVGQKLLGMTRGKLVKYYLGSSETEHKIETNRREFQKLLELTPKKLKQKLS